MPETRFVSPEEEQRILADYQRRVDGRLPTVKEVAVRFGRSHETIRRCAVKAGVYRSERPPVTTAKRKRIVKLYQQKNGRRWMSTVDIAKKLHVSPSTVNRVLDEAGIPRRGTAESLKMDVTPEEREAIIRAYRSKRSISHRVVAERTGVSQYLVYQTLIDAGELAHMGPNSRARVRQSEALCIVGLYEQGRTIKEVAELTDRTRDVVARLVHDAGVIRPAGESISLTAQRKRVRARLAAMDIEPLALRWLAGAEPEDLAQEYEMPADLLWDAVAEALSTMTPPPPPPRSDDDCQPCRFACVAVCGQALPQSVKILAHPDGA